MYPKILLALVRINLMFKMFLSHLKEYYENKATEDLRVSESLLLFLINNFLTKNLSDKNSNFEWYFQIIYERHELFCRVVMSIPIYFI